MVLQIFFPIIQRPAGRQFIIALRQIQKSEKDPKVEVIKSPGPGM